MPQYNYPQLYMKTLKSVLNSWYQATIILYNNISEAPCQRNKYITYAKISSSNINSNLYFLVIPCSANGLHNKIQPFFKAGNAEDKAHKLKYSKESAMWRKDLPGDVWSETTIFANITSIRTIFLCNNSLPFQQGWETIYEQKKQNGEHHKAIHNTSSWEKELRKLVKIFWMCTTQSYSRRMIWYNHGREGYCT